MRTSIASSLVVLVLGSLVALAGDSGPANQKPKPAGKAVVTAPARGTRPDRAETSDAAREVSVLAFVRENHPELADLLEQLKVMKPDQYDRAIAELWKVSRTLANLKNDARRYPVALDVWKTRSRAELLAAQLAGSASASTDLEGQLRAALEHQIGAEIRQQRLERELAAERLSKLDENIKRLESKRDALVESRYQTLVKKGQRARRLEAGQAAPSRSATDKGEN